MFTTAPLPPSSPSGEAGWLRAHAGGRDPPATAGDERYLPVETQSVQKHLGKVALGRLGRAACLRVAGFRNDHVAAKVDCPRGENREAGEESGDDCCYAPLVTGEGPVEDVVDAVAAGADERGRGGDGAVRQGQLPTAVGRPRALAPMHRQRRV